MTMTKPPLLIGALCALTLSLGACSGKEDEGRGNRAAQVGYVVSERFVHPSRRATQHAEDVVDGQIEAEG